MENIFRVVLFLTGLIHLLPFSLAFLPDRIASSYGVEPSGSDLMLLLRHRAVLFGIIGSVMLYSAWSKRYYHLSTFVGLASMLSFILLYGVVGGINEKLKGVMWVDVLASLALSISAVAHRLGTGRRRA